MNFEIKPLTPDLFADFFEFFDTRAFTDNEEFAPCYCTWPHLNKDGDRKLHEEIKADGCPGAFHRALKRKAESILSAGTLRGYLVYAGGTVIGWCNANDKSRFLRFHYDENIDRFIMNQGEGKIKAVACLIIAPEYRRQGIATALMERVIADANPIKRYRGESL
jgi:ribosomal protein S18 acetylase RimI-like enzyme